MHFCWNFLTSEAPDTFNLEIRFFIEDAHLSQTVFSEVIKPLQESFHQVLSFVKYLAFISVLIIMEEPELVSICIILLLQCLHTTTGFVFMVHHKCLEIEEVPRGLWQKVKFFLTERSIFLHFFFLLFLWSWGSFLFLLL